MKLTCWKSACEMMRVGSIVLCWGGFLEGRGFKGFIPLQLQMSQKTHDDKGEMCAEGEGKIRIYIILNPSWNLSSILKHINKMVLGYLHWKFKLISWPMCQRDQNICSLVVVCEFKLKR